MNHNLGELDKFESENYPEVVAEIKNIVREIRNTSIYFRTDIIICYLKNHSIKTEWINANPLIATRMTSGNLSARNVERLFETCRGTGSSVKTLKDI